MTKTTWIAGGLSVLTITGLLALGPGVSAGQPNDRGRELVEELVAHAGGRNALRRLRDVEFKYTYFDPAAGGKDVSVERYVFAGEKSYGRYLERGLIMMPDVEGTVTAFFDGESTTTLLDGAPVGDPKGQFLGDFLRKVNFYWFSMLYKLLDPGANHEYLGKRRWQNVDYDAVQVTFGDEVGDFQDRYVLYINPHTKMLDAFLFNVVGAGITDPSFMTVTWDEIEGAAVPVVRRYRPAVSWEGGLKPDTDWAVQITEDVRFGNGFSADSLAAAARAVR